MELALAGATANYQPHNQLTPDDHQVETDLAYPEQRLWAAVALLLIDDYERMCATIQKLFKSRKQVDIAYKHQLAALRRESESAWFSEICENINVSAHHLQARLNKIELAYGIRDVKFARGQNALNLVGKQYGG